jgi:hypothetical protein
MSKQTKSGPRSIERSWLCAVALASVAVGSAACTTPQSGSARVAAAPNATSSAPTSGAKRAQVDERRPEYWLQRLEHPSQRVSALQRLNGFYEDTVKRVNHDQHNPERLSLVGLLVEPLTRCYVQSYSELDEQTRENLIRLLAALGDPRTAPALAKAFDVFAATQQGRRDVQHAALAVTELQLRSVAAPVFRAFRVFHLSDPEDPVYEALNGALRAVADPAWTQELIGMLATPLRTDEVEDLASRARFLDSLGRVDTAAQVLGELRSPEAARPLLQLLLDPRRLTIKAAVSMYA